MPPPNSQAQTFTLLIQAIQQLASQMQQNNTLLQQSVRAQWAIRVSYAAFYGSLQARVQVCHVESCHNSSCINPDHLKLDTPENNIAERNRRVAANNNGCEPAPF